MNQILKLKHWQVFIALMIFPILTTTGLGDNLPSEFKIAFGIIGIILFFSWILTIGLFLNNIPQNPYKFKAGLFIFAIVCCVIGNGELQLHRIQGWSSRIPILLSAILTPITLLGMIYTFFNVSQSLNTVENPEKSKIITYILDAILIFAYPLGIWVIQPRINRIFKELEYSNK